MSISKPRTGEQNPAAKHIKFKNGSFTYYDRDKEENIVIPLPIEFTVIDELAAVAGWHEKSKSGIYSNEVASTMSDELIVSSWKGGEIARGFYGDIKDKIKAEGGRYEKSVYAVLKGELVRFGFVGAALSAWIEKEVNFTKPLFTVKETKEGKKGATVYQIPIFEASECTQEEWSEAVEIDKNILQPYLDSKDIDTKTLSEGMEESHDIREQNAQCAAEHGTAAAKAEVAESMEEEVDDDLLPF